MVPYANEWVAVCPGDILIIPNGAGMSSKKSGDLASAEKNTPGIFRRRINPAEIKCEAASRRTSEAASPIKRGSAGGGPAKKEGWRIK